MSDMPVGLIMFLMFMCFVVGMAAGWSYGTQAMFHHACERKCDEREGWQMLEADKENNFCACVNESNPRSVVIFIARYGNMFNESQTVLP